MNLSEFNSKANIGAMARHFELSLVYYGRDVKWYWNLECGYCFDF